MDWPCLSMCVEAFLFRSLMSINNNNFNLIFFPHGSYLFDNYCCMEYSQLGCYFWPVCCISAAMKLLVRKHMFFDDPSYEVSYVDGSFLAMDTWRSTGPILDLLIVIHRLQGTELFFSWSGRVYPIVLRVLYEYWHFQFSSLSSWLPFLWQSYCCMEDFWQG